MTDKVSVRDGAIADVEIASAAEGITESSIAGPEGGKGRPMGPNDRAKIVGQPSKGPER